MENPIPHQLWNQLLRKQQQQHARNSRQVKIMNLEQAIQLQRGAITHHLAPAKNDNVVREQRARRHAKRAECRDALLEAEVLRFVAIDCFVGFFEDGPEGEAEG